MLNLFEILQSSQNGAAVEALASRHGLTPKQAETAIDVLLPAFTLALQRQAQNPKGWLGLMSPFEPATATGSPLEAAGRGLTAEGLKQGADVMTRLFGANDLSTQIAAQSAAVSGVPATILQQMMPAMAAMLASGMLKTFSQEGMAGVITAMARGFPLPPAPQIAPAPSPPEPQEASALQSYMDAFQQVMKTMAPVPAEAPAAAVPEPAPLPEPGPAAAPTANPFDPAGFGAALAAMLNAAAPSAASTPPEPEPSATVEPVTAAEPSPSENGPGLIGLVFETGRAVQEQHLAALNGLFDAFLRPDEGQRTNQS